MNATQLAEALQQSTFGSALPAEVAQRLAADASSRRFAPGEVLFREGQTSDSFYVVHRGHLALDMATPGRPTTRLLTVGPGEIVAWSTLVGDGRMTATASALDEVEVVELSGAGLLKSCEAEPALGYHVMRRLAGALAKRLLATRLQMLDLFVADARGDEGAVP